MKNEDLYVYKKSDFYEDFISSQKEYYEREQVDALLAEKDKEIAELKEKLMPCLNGDCILTCEVVEKYGKENAELKQKLEDVQASAYAESVDAGMRERRLKRALWMARASEASKEVNYWTCQDESSYAIVDFNVRHETIVSYKAPHHRPYKWILIWEEVERKCRAKAEEYK